MESIAENKISSETTSKKNVFVLLFLIFYLYEFEIIKNK